MHTDERNEKPLRNPYAGSDTYNCFGCAPDNQAGLRLMFTLRGQTIVSSWEPRAEFEGYPGVIHGGIQATLADETAAWFIHAVLGTAGITRELTTKYHKPAKSADGPFQIEARSIESSPRHASIEVTICGRSGTLFTTARGEFALFSEKAARRRLGFPGASAFFDS